MALTSIRSTGCREETNAVGMAAFRCCLPAEIAVTFSGWDLGMLWSPCRSTRTCRCFWYQPCFHAFGEYPGRRRNQFLVPLLAYYLFQGAEPADKYSLRHSLLKTAVFISRFNCFFKRAKITSRKHKNFFMQLRTFFKYYHFHFLFLT